MRSTKDDPDHRELVRRAHELAGELTTLYDKMREATSKHLGANRLGDALREYEALRQKRDELEGQYILVLQGIRRLKVNRD
jgi:hypothetical protein